MTNKFFPEIKGKFGFGGMRLPMTGGKVDMPQFTQMVDAFLATGLNYLDTAHGYLGGQSETALREALTSRYSRDEYILTNKLSTHFFTREEQIRPLFEEQLQACGVEYFDFYLMHAQDGAIFEKFQSCRAYETALELKAEGKINHFGMADSIKRYGVLVPGMVRPKEGGGYEMVAGHRRKMGSELAQKTTMPCLVRDLTEDEAI